MRSSYPATSTATCRWRRRSSSLSTSANCSRNSTNPSRKAGDKHSPNAKSWTDRVRTCSVGPSGGRRAADKKGQLLIGRQRMARLLYPDIGDCRPRHRRQHDLRSILTGMLRAMAWATSPTPRATDARACSRTASTWCCATTTSTHSAMSARTSRRPAPLQPAALRDGVRDGHRRGLRRVAEAPRRRSTATCSNRTATAFDLMLPGAPPQRRCWDGRSSRRSPRRTSPGCRAAAARRASRAARRIWSPAWAAGCA